MNRIEKLIAELCPDGVEWKKLGEVTISLKKDTLKLTDLVPNGKYPVINSGREWYGRYNSYNNEGNAITIAARGNAGYINYIGEKFWAGGLCYPYRSKDENLILTKYIFYALKAHEKIIMQTLVSRGSIPALNKTDIDNFLIPIPPLPIQEEIVKILDTFTALEAELEAELEARRKQYEYYRNKLLTPVEHKGRWYLNGKEVEWKKLGEVCEVCSGGTPSKNKEEYWINGNIPWLKSEVCNNQSVKSANSFINELGLKNSNAKLLRENTTLMALVGATIFKTAFLEFKASINQNIAAIKSIEENKLKDKFIFYCLTNMYKELKSKMNSYGMLNLSILRNISIPIPPFSEQERIVAILDKFDALVNDLTSGLPAEIEARRKQYEYYRDKLLNFNRYHCRIDSHRENCKGDS